MHVTIEARSIANAMRLPLAIIERRNTIPILSTVRLTYGANGVTITATDLDIAAYIKVDEIDGDGEFSFCIEAHIFSAIARANGVSPLRIEPVFAPTVEKGELTPIASVTITSGDDIRYDVTNILPASDFPDMSEKRRAVLIETFTNGLLSSALGRVSWCISTEETRYYLDGVCWDFKDGKRRFAATDGHRLAICRYSSGADAIPPRIIPRKTVAILRKFFDRQDVSVFAIDGVEAMLDFVGDNITMRSKMIDGTFPDIDRVIPQNAEYRLDARQDEFARAIRQAIAVGFMNDGKAIRLRDDGGRMIVELKNIEFGSGTVRTSAAWPEGLSPLGFNASYMLDILANCQNEIRIGANDAGSPIVVTDEDETMTRVCMPMRV